MFNKTSIAELAVQAWAKVSVTSRISFTPHSWDSGRPFTKRPPWKPCDRTPSPPSRRLTPDQLLQGGLVVVCTRFLKPSSPVHNAVIQYLKQTLFHELVVEELFQLWARDSSSLHRNRGPTRDIPRMNEGLAGLGDRLGVSLRSDSRFLGKRLLHRSSARGAEILVHYFVRPVSSSIHACWERLLDQGW